ncbi:hypothetical protein [Legionella hackeliae]|nr:hypothetical protein [Legionella hackeliae]
MKITNRDIVQANRNVYKRNCKARYNSKEEKIFTMSSAAGLLLFWNPYVPEEGSFTRGNKQIGLPVEIGQLIGSYLSRCDAAVVVQVCLCAFKSAIAAKEVYVKAHGQSYQEESYTPLVFF